MIYRGDGRIWHLSYQLSRTVFLPRARGPARQVLHASRGGRGDACMDNAAVCPAQVVGGAWLFSRLYCNIFVTLDVMMCTASILNLCAISIDRWVHVYLWLIWRRKRTFFSSSNVWMSVFTAFWCSLFAVLLQEEPQPDIIWNFIKDADPLFTLFIHLVLVLCHS